MHSEIALLIGNEYIISIKRKINNPMNKTLLPTLIGAFTSLAAIWLIHTYLMVDDCLANGGTFEYSTGKCLLENGEIYDSGLATYALVLYFVVGFSVSFIVSNLIRKFFKIGR